MKIGMKAAVGAAGAAAAGAATVLYLLLRHHKQQEDQETVKEQSQSSQKSSETVMEQSQSSQKSLETPSEKPKTVRIKEKQLEGKTVDFEQSKQRVNDKTVREQSQSSLKSSETVREQSQSGQKSSETVRDEPRTVRLKEKQSEVKTASEQTNNKTVIIEQSECKKSKLKEIKLIEDTTVKLGQSQSPQTVNQQSQSPKTVTLEQSDQNILENIVTQSDNQSSQQSQSPKTVTEPILKAETVNIQSQSSQKLEEKVNKQKLTVKLKQSDEETVQLKQSEAKTVKEQSDLSHSEAITVKLKQLEAKTVIEQSNLSQSQAKTVTDQSFQNLKTSQNQSKNLEVANFEFDIGLISVKSLEYILDNSENFDSEFYEPKNTGKLLEKIVCELREGENIGKEGKEGIKEGKEKMKEGRKETEGREEEGRKEGEDKDGEKEGIKEGKGELNAEETEINQKNEREEEIREKEEKGRLEKEKEEKGRLEKGEKEEKFSKESEIIKEGEEIKRKRERQRTRGDSASADLEYEPPEQEGVEHEQEQQEISENSVNYDAASDKSMDSGQGSSEIEPETLFQLSSYPPPSNEQFIFYDFEIKQTLVGRLIGRQGAFVNKIKATTQATVLVHGHPNRHYKMCTVEGTRSQVESALEMIRQMFPMNRYPDVTLEQVIAANSSPSTGLPINIDTNSMKMELAAGVMVEVRVSSVVSGGEIFVHQPLHPNFSALHRLHNCLKLNYGDGTNTPPLPSPIQEGTVCVGNVEGEWVRCQVISEYQGEVVCLLLDTGSTAYINCSALRQIRYDYMALPFQATQCFLYGIQPKDGDMWSEDASTALSELVGDDILFCCVQCYTQEYVPIISLYKTLPTNEHIHLNQRLVELGHADWIPQPS